MGLMRDKIDEFGGFEVKTEGDAFMVAFEDVTSAVRFGLIIQEELLSVDWPQEIYDHEDAAIEYDDDGKLLYRGLRVRMGIHTGEPRCEPDPITGRMDYFGPMG